MVCRSTLSNRETLRPEQRKSDEVLKSHGAWSGFVALE
jgi:hypothetical protein